MAWGKTTMLRAILGLAETQAGKISLDGEDLTPLAINQRARSGLAWVPEGGELFPMLTVTETLDLAIMLAGSGKKNRAAMRSYLWDLFPELEARRHSRAAALSGGERRMLAMGRALMSQPRLMLVDEATEGLAPRAAETIWNVFERARENGTACLIVDKNIKRLLTLADDILVMAYGQIVYSNTTISASPDHIARLVGL